MENFDWEKIKSLNTNRNKEKYKYQETEDSKLEGALKLKRKRFIRDLGDLRGRMKSTVFQIKERSMIKSGGKI